MIRSIFLPDTATQTIPLPHYNSVQAGFPSPADDYLEGALSLDAYIVKNKSATFFVRVEGDSMIEAGIYDGCLLVVDRSLQAQHNDVVVAILDNAFLVKRLDYQSKCTRLLSAHPDYPSIEITYGEDFRIWGVVTYVLHEPQR